MLSDDDEFVNTDQEKLAEADMMGRQMAHSYIDEINNLSTQGADMYNEDDLQVKVASVMNDVAEAWHMEKQALSRLEQAKMMMDPTYDPTQRAGNVQLRDYYKRMERRSEKGVDRFYKDKVKKMDRKPAFSAARAKDAGEGFLSRAGKHLGAHKGKYLAGAAGAAALGAGALALKKRRDNQKKTAAFLDNGWEASAYINEIEPEEFAKEAEFRAAEILLANGVDPETFDEVRPQEVKIASFPGVEDAADWREAQVLEEYNDMLDTAAMHIIDEIFG